MTAVRNVPLNEALEAFDLGGATGAEIDHRRRTYERPWNRWNTVRSVANVASFTLAVAAASVAERLD